MLRRNRNDYYYWHRFITADETRIHHSTPDTKQWIQVHTLCFWRQICAKEDNKHLFEGLVQGMEKIEKRRKSIELKVDYVENYNQFCTYFFVRAR